MDNIQKLEETWMIIAEKREDKMKVILGSKGMIAFADLSQNVKRRMMAETELDNESAMKIFDEEYEKLI